MATEWFVRNGEKITGPFETSQLVKLAREGKVSRDSRVRKGTDNKWYKASNVLGLFPATEAPLHAPATFLDSLFASWRIGRGSWIWVVPVALAALPLLSLLKPVLFFQGLLLVMAALAGLTILLRLSFFLGYLWLFYVRDNKEVRRTAGLSARLGGVALLLIPVVGLLTFAEFFSTSRGLVVDYIPPASQQQERLLAWLGYPLEPARIDRKPLALAKAEHGIQQKSDFAKKSPDDELVADDVGPKSILPKASQQRSKSQRGADQPPQADSQMSVGEATWALLIGVKGYKTVPPLKSTANDVERIGESLVRIGNVPDAQIFRVTDDRPTKPDYGALMATIEEVLANPGIKADNHLIIYYSGHGLLDADEAMYLAPRDVDMKDIKSTAISTAWLRERLRECRASVKLLVLDACHSGASKSTLPIIDGSKLAGEFKYGSGVITISGCKGEQFSWESPKLNQGIFTYYLVEALHGAADRDRNERIDVDELYRYVSERVPEHTLEEFQAAQDPVRWIGPDVVGVPEIIQLPEQFRGPQPETDTEPHSSKPISSSDGGKVRTLLSEGFGSVRVGQLPRNWVGDSGIGVRVAGDQAWLQPSSKGLHHVRSMPFDVRGDFQLELTAFLPPLGEIRVTLEGLGTADLKCGIRRDYGPHGQSYLAGAQTARVEGLGEQGNRLTIQREDDAYIFRVDDQVVTVHRIDNPGRLQRLWLETNQPETRVDNVSIQLAIADEGRMTADPPKQLFLQDFAKVKLGNLPNGWSGPDPLGVELDGSIGWLRASKDGQVTAAVELPTIRGDFELSSLFTLPPLGNLQIGLAGGSQPTIAAIRRHYGPQGTASLADAKPVQFEGLSDYVSRLALRREGDVYSFIIDGHKLLVHRIQGLKVPTKLEVTIDSAETRVFNTGIWQLPASSQ